MNTKDRDDEESVMSHTFRTTSKIANAQVREVVKDSVFPKAKFLREEDMTYSNTPTSWCQKMASWCHIEPNNLQVWWQTAQAKLMQELQHQRANKTNVIKREFFGKQFVCLATWNPKTCLVTCANKCKCVSC